jgi:hypothetical protein
MQHDNEDFDRRLLKHVNQKTVRQPKLTPDTPVPSGILALHRAFKLGSARLDSPRFT